MLQVDLDVLVRADLMSFLKEESERRGCTIVHITHIFDGMEGWPTHLGFMTHEGFEAVVPAEEVPELKEGRLMELVEKFLFRQRKLRLEALANGRTVQHPEAQHQRDYAYALNNGYSAGRMASTVK
jgi:CCR4-NOT complex subunit CAF16